MAAISSASSVGSNHFGFNPPWTSSFRTGGDAPHGFVRVHVDCDVNVPEELPPDKTVRQPGCHVRIMPKDEEKLRTRVLILDLKHRGWSKRRMYVCGRYMKTAGAECENNAVDAEAILRVAVESLCQLMQFGGAEDKLRARLAAAAAATPRDADTKRLEAQITTMLQRREQVRRQQETVGRRMATESDDDRYRAISAAFDELTAELKQIDEQLQNLQAR